MKWVSRSCHVVFVLCSKVFWNSIEFSNHKQWVRCVVAYVSCTSCTERIQIACQIKSRSTLSLVVSVSDPVNAGTHRKTYIEKNRICDFRHRSCRRFPRVLFCWFGASCEFVCTIYIHTYITKWKLVCHSAMAHDTFVCDRSRRVTACDTIIDAALKMSKWRANEKFDVAISRILSINYNDH